MIYLHGLSAVYRRLDFISLCIFFFSGRSKFQLSAWLPTVLADVLSAFSQFLPEYYLDRASN